MLIVHEMEIEDIRSKNMDITELILQLQREKLLVDAERSNLELLNEELLDHTNKLIKATWINSQQRVNLNCLVARPEYTPEQCCRRSVALANCNFIDAKDVYDYQTVTNFTQFLSLLRNRTEQLAQWIVIGERLSKDSQLFCQILQTIIAGLYGSLLLPEDISMLLNLLRYLARFQLVTTDSPRRKLSQGSCAFSKMYLLFHESLPSAKLFLIAALQQPIINLIANTNEYLNIDPDKTIERFSVVERFEKFGALGNSEYDTKVAEFRKYVLDELAAFAQGFIYSIQENIYCFPSTLASLIKHIIQMISQSFGEHSKEVTEISTDLIFTLYICPAIVNPEPYGVCDAPIPPAARHNLIQVSQLLQQLALRRNNDTSATSMCNGDVVISPVKRLLSDRFESISEGAVADVMEVLLGRLGEEGLEEGIGMEMEEEEAQVPVVGVQREFVVATELELNNLVSFLVKAHNTTQEDLGGVNETASSASEMFVDTPAHNIRSQPQPLLQLSTVPPPMGSSGAAQSGCDRLFTLLTKLPTEGGASPRGSLLLNGGVVTVGQQGHGAQQSKDGSPTHSGSSGSSRGSGGMGVGGGRRQMLMNKVTGKAHSHHQLRTSSSSDSDDLHQPLVVLLIPLHTDRQHVGLLPENKVLAMNNDVAQDLLIDTSSSVVDAVNTELLTRNVLTTGQEKRTRFGAGDEGSIGNTSDNLEAISEAASNHSVASSMELEEHEDDDDDDDDDDVDVQNDGDNLSDMVSANVSGRGSPNISGRDTPSSQVTENEDGRCGGGGGGGVGAGAEVGVIGGEVRPVYNSNSQHVITKQIRTDIDDKFCKFEIRQQLLAGDETVSIISDTWSTDVLASDSETVDAADSTSSVPVGGGGGGRHFSPIVEQPVVGVVGIVGGVVVVGGGLLDISETQSESAWSTDVLASDTERLTEVDNDDLASVAPSDDTASVARSDDAASVAPSEPDEPPPLLPDRKLSTASTGNYSTVSSYEYAQQLDQVASRGTGSSSASHNESSVTIGRRESAPAQSFLLKATEDDADGAQSGHMLPEAFGYPEIISGPTVGDEKIDISAESSVLRQSVSRSCSDMSSRREAIMIEVGTSTNRSKAVYKRHTHTTVHTTSRTHGAHLAHASHRPLLPLADISNSLMGGGGAGATSGGGMVPVGGGGKVGDSVTGNAAAYLLVKNISTQKYDSTADSQLSNTSLNSSSSGSSNGSEHQSKGIMFGGSGGHRNGGKWKQKWNDNHIHTTLIENTTADVSHLNISGNSVSSNGSGKKILANGSAVSVNGGHINSNSKPTAATGAIPKSISFDMSAEKGDKDHHDEENKGRRSGGSGILGKLRANLKSRRGKGVAVNREEFPAISADRRVFSEHIARSTQNSSEISEDILAKYRTSRTKENGSVINSETFKQSKVLELDDNDNQLILIESDPNSMNCAFEDAKKKLRIVLSNSKSRNIIKDGRKHTKKDLETFLQLEMAKANHFKQWSTAARISETLRCIKLLDVVGFHKLCDVLHSDYCNRKVYTQYLLHSRQILLSSHSFLEELTEQVERESELCSTFLVSICVRLYLDRYNLLLQDFTAEFKRLTLVDEKNDLLSTFLKNLYSQMTKDSIWQDATICQIELTQIAIERSVMTEVYLHALHPNGDMDRERDRMLNEHLAKLGRALTPDHKDLLIGPLFRREAPWLPAQAALRSLAAYRAARDKVRCVARCAGTIMALLSLGQGRGSTAADDFVPVLVYVIIKTNPQDLLSTIQYVKSFYGNQLMGEEEYWWTQFCSAVEFTKTMEYSD